MAQEKARSLLVNNMLGPHKKMDFFSLFLAFLNGRYEIGVFQSAFYDSLDFHLASGSS